MAGNVWKEEAGGVGCGARRAGDCVSTGGLEAVEGCPPRPPLTCPGRPWGPRTLVRSTGLRCQEAFTSPAPRSSHMSGVMRTGKPAGRPEHTAPRREEGATGSATLTSRRPHPAVFTFEKWWAAAGTRERNGQERRGLRGAPHEPIQAEGMLLLLLPPPTPHRRIQRSSLLAKPFPAG